MSLRPFVLAFSKVHQKWTNRLDREGFIDITLGFSCTWRARSLLTFSPALSPVSKLLGGRTSFLHQLIAAHNIRVGTGLKTIHWQL